MATADIPLKVKAKAQRSLTSKQETYVREILCGNSCFTAYLAAYSAANLTKQQILTNVRALNRHPAVSALLRNRELRLIDDAERRPAGQPPLTYEIQGDTGDNAKPWISARLQHEAVAAESARERIAALSTLMDLYGLRVQQSHSIVEKRDVRAIETRLVKRLEQLAKLRQAQQPAAIDVAAEPVTAVTQAHDKVTDDTTQQVASNQQKDKE